MKKSEREWRPGWDANRVHAEVSPLSERAWCGFVFPRRVPRKTKWFKRKMSEGVPKCKKCLKALGEEETQKNKCHWSEDYGIWDTECCNLFEFNADGPLENGFQYCPYCGGKLELA